jgi:hypothetical protein
MCDTILFIYNKIKFKSRGGVIILLDKIQNLNLGRSDSILSLNSIL